MNILLEVRDAEDRIYEHARKSGIATPRTPAGEGRDATRLRRRIIKTVELSKSNGRLGVQHQKGINSILSNLEKKAHYWIRKNRMSVGLFEKYSALYIDAFCGCYKDEHDDLIPKSGTTRRKRTEIYRAVFKAKAI